MKEITEAEKLLLQVANMSCGDLPLSTQDNHKNIWAAFYAGIAWHEACLTKRAADETICTCTQGFEHPQKPGNCGVCGKPFHR